MSGYHKIIYNGGNQNIYVVPINKSGKATSVSTATYSLIDLRLNEDDGTRIIVSGNATIDSTSTTTTQICGMGTVNSQKIFVNSVVGFLKDHFYLITQDDGIRELIKIEAIGSNYVIAKNEISRRYPIAATLKGIEVSAQFPSLEASNEESLDNQGGPYAIDWAWDLDNSPVRDLIFIIRQSDTLLVTEDDIKRLDSSFAATTANRTQISDCIAQSVMEIKSMMEMQQINPNTFHGSDALKLAVIYRTAWHIIKYKPGPENQERMTLYKEEANRYLENVLVGKVPQSTVITNPVSDSAAAGSSKKVNHWQILS